MSTIKKIKVFTSDDRGEITDIFTHEPKDHCTIVTFKKMQLEEIIFIK